MEGYLQGDLSKPDEELLQRWYASFGESTTGVPGLEDEASSEELREELDSRIRELIAIPEPKKVSWFRTKGFRYMAAASFAAVIGGAVWLTTGRLNKNADQDIAAQHKAFDQIETGIRQVKRVILPDSTTVFLNSNSTLKISASFGKVRREVSLSGEAFFDVKRNPEKPFIIAASGLKVKVLGTSFNVSAYDALPDVRVAVNTGLVQVADQHKVLSNLKPNKMLAYNKETHGYSVKNMNAGSVSSWREGIIQLNHATFRDFQQAMLNTYGVHVGYADAEPATRFNYTVRSTRPLEQTLEQFSEVVGKKYRKEGDRVVFY